MSDEMTLTDWIAILSRRRLIAFGVFAIVLVLGGLASLRDSATYEARATVLLRTTSSQQLFPEVGPSQSAFFRLTSTAELEYVRSTEFRALATASAPAGVAVVASVFGNDGDAAALVARSSNQLLFEASGDDEADVVAAANTWARVYVDERSARTQAEAASSIDALDGEVQLLQDEIDALSAPLEEIDAAILAETDPGAAEVLSAQREALSRSLEPQLEPLRSQLGTLSSDLSSLRVRARQLETDGISARVNQEAIQAAGSEPSVARNLVLAAVVGSIIAVGAALLVDNLRGRVYTRRELELAVDAPTFAVVPTGDGSSVSHAIEDVATALNRLPDAAEGGRRVVFVSPTVPSDVTGRLVSSLAATIDGHDGGVAVVDADLRSPTLSRLLGASPATPGIVDLLNDDGDLASLSTKTEHRGVELVAAGSVDDLRGTVAAHYRSDRFANLVDKIAGDHRLSLVAGGALVGLSDSMALLDAVGAHVVLVVEAGTHRRSDVLHASERLSDSGHRLVGTVLFDS